MKVEKLSFQTESMGRCGFSTAGLVGFHFWEVMACRHSVGNSSEP